jgi:predicted phosphoadenosine phosphosulfate sulfurtransferase
MQKIPGILQEGRVTTMESVLVSWSGGKDSAMALPV